MGEPRSLPIRVPPLPGEALDSWFDALAYRLQVPVSDLLPALGLSAGARRRADRALDIPADWTILLRPTEAGAIACASASNHESRASPGLGGTRSGSTRSKLALTMPAGPASVPVYCVAGPP